MSWLLGLSASVEDAPRSSTARLAASDDGGAVELPCSGVEDADDDVETSVAEVVPQALRRLTPTKAKPPSTEAEALDDLMLMIHRPFKVEFAIAG